MKGNHDFFPAWSAFCQDWLLGTDHMFAMKKHIFYILTKKFSTFSWSTKYVPFLYILISVNVCYPSAFLRTDVFLLFYSDDETDSSVDSKSFSSDVDKYTTYQVKIALVRHNWIWTYLVPFRSWRVLHRTWHVRFGTCCLPFQNFRRSPLAIRLILELQLTPRDPNYCVIRTHFLVKLTKTYAFFSA